MADFLQTPATITQIHLFNQMATKASFDAYADIADANGDSLAALRDATLNVHYDRHPTEYPDSFELPRVRYFGIGIAGTLSNGTTRIPRANNAHLYYPIPFRVLTEAAEAELDAEVKALYRMREEFTIGGANYVRYWLKLIEWEDQPKVITEQVAAGESPVTTVIDPDLTPMYDGEVLVDENEVTDDASQVIATIPGTLEVTFDEINEAFTLMEELQGLDMHINELGIYTGIDREVTGVVEAVFVHLAFHRCSTGFEMTPGGTRQEQMTFESGNLALL